MCFVSWNDFATRKRRLKIGIEKKLSKERQLLKWVVMVEWQNHGYREAEKGRRAEARYGKSLLSKAFCILRGLRELRCVALPQAAARALLLPKYFSLYREIYSATFVSRVVSPFLRIQSLKRYLLYWRSRRLLKRKVAALLDVVGKAIVKRHMRRIVREWPGRYEFTVAEDMRKRLLSKGRGRARLVDVLRPPPLPRSLVPSLLQAAVDNRLSVHQRMHNMVSASVHKKLSLQVR